MQYDEYGRPVETSNYNSRSLTSNVSRAMRLVYVNMTLALVVTGIVAWLCAGSMAYMSYMYTSRWTIWILFFIELAIVWGVTAGINRLSVPVASLLFYAFAVLNGLTLAPIFMVYTQTSIAKTFFITAGTFGAMSIYGFFTSSDLTKFGSLFFMALIGLIIAFVVNIFLHSSALNWIITIAGVLIFVGLTAWDTQQIKRMAAEMPDAGLGRLGVLGALALYLDFINLFIFLLRIFGGSRD